MNLELSLYGSRGKGWWQVLAANDFPCMSMHVICSSPILVDSWLLTPLSLLLWIAVERRKDQYSAMWVIHRLYTYQHWFPLPRFCAQTWRSVSLHMHDGKVPIFLLVCRDCKELRLHLCPGEELTWIHLPLLQDKSWVPLVQILITKVMLTATQARSLCWARGIQMSKMTKRR